jgi:hypothetical protein
MKQQRITRRYPHDQPAQLLVGKQRACIQHPRCECEQRRQRTAVYQQCEHVENRHARAHPPQHRPPEQQGGKEECRVLHRMHAIAGQRGIEQQRHMPDPERQRMQDQRGQRW